MSRAGELREKDIARRVRRAKGESLTARNDAVTTEKERANEGDGNPMKDANDAGLNSPPPTPAVVDERRGVTGGLNALSPAAPTREGGAVASDDARGDENIAAADPHSAEPDAQRDVEVTETGANEESDGTCTDTNVEIHSDGDERPEDREELTERVDGGEDAPDGDGGGCHTGPDSSGVPSGQYMEASPDARGVAGLEKFAQVDIHDCEECMNALDECGKDVAKFRPCDTHLNELYEKTKAYGTHCLNPGHEAQHEKLQLLPGGGIKFNRFGALSDWPLKPGFSGRKTIRFDRDKARGFCKQCQMVVRDRQRGQKRKEPAGPPNDAVQQDAVDALSEVDALVIVKVYVPVKLRDIDATKANCGHIRDLVTVDEVVKAAAQSGADIGRQFSSRQHNVRQDAKGRFFLE